MKNLSIVCLTFLLVTACVPAQTTWTQQRQINATGSDCPVGLLADRSGSAWERKLARYPDPASPSQEGPLHETPGVATFQQSIHLTVTNLSSREIVSAELTVHGFSDHWRTFPLSGSGTNPDRTQQLKVAVSVKGNDHATRDLALSRFTAVTSIDVTTLTYADGSIWHAPSTSACSVSPSLLTLVSSNR